WLGMSDPQGKWLSVYSDLSKVHASWVNAHVGWDDLANGNTDGTYAQIEQWASLVTQAPYNMNFLLSVDYHAPSGPDGFARQGCTVPESGNKDAGKTAIDSMRSAVRGLYNYDQMSTYWPHIQLEI